jgi:serine/threonine protein kinase/tetratricopeptide (TPR) repeat protein
MALTVDQMARMSRLLEEALPLDAAGRQLWLQELGPEHQDLAAALRRALVPAEDNDAPQKPGMVLAQAHGSVVLRGLQPGERIGPYALVRLLGEGGMAEVWLAQRADGVFHREVALKLPMLARLRKDLASRFARERNILAAMEHPNIARLYDAGVSAEGLPYLAMEYVQGSPLTIWCDTHRLGVRERMKLFLQVLDAVQYAHGKQVIHRDIKPSNILVTNAGQVRLLDFGVAKLLAEEDEQTQLTQIYGRALTPEYAAPEFVRGEQITASADVYSLGVVLYELLCGSRPHRLAAGNSAGALEQAIVTSQVEPPSTQLTTNAALHRSTTDDELARRLRGDLDAIALRAVFKAPADRYSSVAAFADDVQRYLAGEPSEARAVHRGYRLARFAGRHKAGTALTVVAAVIVAAGAGYGLWKPAANDPMTQTKSTSSPQSARTNSADDKSIAVLPFVDMSEKHDQEYFSDGLSEELIDRLSHSPDLKVISRTSSFYFKNRQATMGEIAGTLNVSHVLEGSVRKSGNALRITAQLIRASDGSHLWSQTYERPLSDVFKVQEEIAGTVAQALKAALSGGSRPEGRRTPTSEAYNAVLQGDYAYFRAYDRPTMQTSIDFYEKALKLDPAYALGWGKLYRAYYFLGFIESDPSQAKDAFARASVALNRSLQLDPGLAFTHQLRAGQYRYEWKWDAAQRELELARQLDPTNPSLPASFASQALITGHIDEAIEVFREDLAHDPVRADAWASLGQALFDARRFDESAAVWSKALELSPKEPFSNYLYGASLLHLDRKEQALTAMEKETNDSARMVGLSSALWALGRKSESNEQMKALEAGRFGTHPMFVAVAHAYRGEKDAAFQWLERAYREHDPLLQLVKITPQLDNLRDDPRYSVLLVKMKLAD